MTARRGIAFVVIAMSLLVIDCLLGLACVKGLPKIVFLVVNFPFGVIFVWFESCWTGKSYVIGGQTVNEHWAFVAFFVSVFLQTSLYWGLWLLRDRRAQIRHRMQAGLCIECGYDLQGNVSGVCPECGCRTSWRVL